MGCHDYSGATSAASGWSGAGGPIRSCAIIPGMDKKTQQTQLNENWAKYCAERDKRKAEGMPAIGTFSSWQFENKLIKFEISRRG